MVTALRVATIGEADAITELVNAAFRVEDFFKTGDRTDVSEVRRHFVSGQFLVLDADAPSPSRRRIAGCVYLEQNGSDAYFGMLSVDPDRQRQGIGRLLIDALEARCRDAGCTHVEIHVINLREELPPLYRRFGYVETGTMPGEDEGLSTMPYHFIVMRKVLLP